MALPGWSQDDKKLFFFYSLEAPRGQRPPGPIRRYRLPTELERRGDFSQTRDQQGRLIFIRDPQRSGTCNILTGGDGCFPGNIVPSNRIDANGQSLLNIFPVPNRTDLESTGHNYLRQETAKHPRLNNVVEDGLEADVEFVVLQHAPPVRVEADRLGDHRRSAGLGLVRRHLRVQRQLDQRRLEQGDRRAASSTS